MSVLSRGKIRHTQSRITRKIKPGGITIVSQAMVKPSATNLAPKMHIKRGDMVVLIAGPDKTDKKRSAPEKKRLDQRNAYKGQVGKVLTVSPDEGTITVEGINLITRATKQKSVTGKSGLLKMEGPIFASKVMLYCAACKKPTRVKNKVLDKGKRTRVCRHCNEAFDA